MTRTSRPEGSPAQLRGCQNSEGGGEDSSNLRAPPLTRIFFS
eukprot:CAMPEP_0183297648 /NCGR_PEP_ID=MMETSP0160_2-20130417/4885_1 /TAXON_ID=2839 ORGANISM="Odontella Sinensis, Strain Grunow 1884" /NCGR_SAMPLE_ID=MMETSP0160_2 /ASSEMBLY_ACC=CAM_ASM_000250 /LENGTH=41 /DNA_ID= /DNA_START= /DNA_END= /DNA_ORIENTATION=